MRGINWKNPITRGLGFCVSPNHGFVDSVVGYKPTTLSGDPGVIPQPNGLLGVGTISASQWKVHYPVADRYTAGNAYTVEAYVYVRDDDNIGGTSDQGIIFSAGAWPNVPWQLFINDIDNPTTPREIYFEVAGDTPMNSGVAAGDNTVHHIVGVVRYTGSQQNAELWVDGVLVDTQSNVTPSAFGGSFGLGERADNGEGALDGGVLKAAYWPNRALAEPEILSLYRNPWQMFKPHQRWIPIEHTGGISTIGVQAEPPTSTGDIIIYLVDATGSALSNLSNLSWAWFDESSVATITSPTDTGTGASTDVSGTFEISIPNSSLTTGQTGILIVRSSDGYTYGNYKVTL